MSCICGGKLSSEVREPAVFARKKEHLGIENTPIFFTPCIFSRIAQLTKAFFPSLHSKVRSFPLPQHVTLSPTPTRSMLILHREWGFAVRLAIKYHSSPSGRDKEGKGIHYFCWLKSDFGTKAVHGWIVFGTHRLSTCFCKWHAVQSSLLVDRLRLPFLFVQFVTSFTFFVVFSPSWR